MYRKVLKRETMKTVGEFTIVKSVEEMYFDDGKKCGNAVAWYDICLDGGDGDIICSCSDIDTAVKLIEGY